MVVVVLLLIFACCAAGPLLAGRRRAGDHGGFFQVEASGSEEALNLLPEAIRANTKVFPGETMAIP